MASPQQSGYQCQFVDSVEDYECPLCLHVTREPFLTSCCGQHFCQVCITKILTDNKPCPFCKNTSFSTFLDKKQKRRVLDLKVYCDKKTEGCQWVSGLGELEEHLVEKCQFVEVNCSNNCGLVMQRQLLEAHRLRFCLNRPHDCEHCNLRGTYQEIEDHYRMCPKYPVSCLNECGVSPLERDQLEDHLRECPLQLVECELREMGCEEMVKRKDLVKHMEEGTQKHLTLIASKYLKSQADVHERFNKLEEENEGLRKEVCSLKGQLEQYRKYHSSNLQKIHVNLTTLRKQSPTLTVLLYKRWENDTTFHTFPSNCKMKINLYPLKKKLDIELTHVPSEVDDTLQWPKWFTMTVKLVNQAGDYDHYQLTQDVEVEREGFNNKIHILFATIEKPPHKAQYIRNDHIKLEILVSEK